MTPQKKRPANAPKPTKQTSLPDLALGSWEAAAVCGVHFTRVKRMAASGQLIYRPMDSAWTTAPDGQPKNEYLLYSLHDCDDEHLAYMAKLAEGGTGRRPRDQHHLAQHDEMLAALAKVEPILYDDAISTAQAAAVLGCHITWVNQLIRDGKLRARAAMNGRRKSGGRVYIVSRRSCEENRAAVLVKEKAGAKSGKPRSKPVGVVTRVAARTKDS